MGVWNGAGGFGNSGAGVADPLFSRRLALAAAGNLAGPGDFGDDFYLC